MSIPTHHEAMWQAIHAAYEARDPAEARRLLQHATPQLTCDYLHRCSDEDYIKWLLENQLIPSGDLGSAEDAWPGLQESQLQCNALPEAQRPDCIVDGNLPESG
ncbi:MAG: hypothetical protein IKA23_04870 [Akkermansia sp.]|nr:hypothetical protein [Akkermansia sp.]MBR2313705.1 hypothetical protein [Akkermansia sp.]